jgi:hypothetical protein
VTGISRISQIADLLFSRQSKLSPVGKKIAFEDIHRISFFFVLVLSSIFLYALFLFLGIHVFGFVENIGYSLQSASEFYVIILALLWMAFVYSVVALSTGMIIHHTSAKKMFDAYTYRSILNSALVIHAVLSLFLVNATYSLYRILAKVN